MEVLRRKCRRHVRIMSTLNRLANARNEYQGQRKRVLCVCSAGMLRAPTIAWVLSNEPYGCNTRAAGIVPEYALILVDEVLLKWCDMVVCAEEVHAVAVKKMFETFEHVHDRDRLIIPLAIPDDYEFRQKELVDAIKEKLSRIKEVKW